MGLLIVNLAPGVKFRQDTLNTLKYARSLRDSNKHVDFLPSFAARTKNIENKPVVNERGSDLPPSASELY